MPFKSAQQRAWMFKNKPELAKKWAERYGYNVKNNKSKLSNKKARAARLRALMRKQKK